MAMLTFPVGNRDHFRGPTDAPVTMVEYGDFECPYCGEAYYDLKEVGEQMGPQLRFVFRDFPLSTTHPHAEQAAVAAEAAGAQGKFWEMHDILFENQDALEEENLREYARALGLDLEKFELDMRTRRYLPKVKDDFLSGVRSGVSGTPSFFINGVGHEGLFDAASLLHALKQATKVKMAR